MNPEMKSRIEFRPNLIEMTFFVVFVSSALLLRLSIKRSIFPNESGLQHVSPIPWLKRSKAASVVLVARENKTEEDKEEEDQEAHDRNAFSFIIINIAALLVRAPPVSSHCEEFHCAEAYLIKTKNETFETFEK